MSQHTPGPWQSCNCKHCGFVFGDAGNVFVAKAYGPWTGNDDCYPRPLEETARANTVLIAAAPDLLEVLSNLVEAVRMAAHGEYSPREDEWLDRAEELIHEFTEGGS